MFFLEPKTNLKLTIADSVAAFFSNVQQNGRFEIEMGGILVGQLCPSENKIILTDITTPQNSDKQTSTRFIRFEKGHQEIMDSLWEKSRHKKFYLGEWHTHNQDIPSPSNIDIKNWDTISKRNHESERLFFIIIGKKEIKVWVIHNRTITQMDK